MLKVLPIERYKDEIIETVNGHSITILVGETGSGKSTKVCQYLYCAGYDVIVTEPRRLAAVSLANRVASEMQDDTVVSYKTGFESTENDGTRILFCTDGLQLVRSLARRKQRELERPRVLIIDEVHEWNLNQETLVAWIKHQFCTGGFDNLGHELKIVIMSATMDSEDLAEYTGWNTAIMNVPGSLYPVAFINKSESEYNDAILSLYRDGKNVLAFTIGKAEIQNIIKELREKLGESAVILPLHGDLSMEEQRKAFLDYGEPKIIVSTNVAQTSVTINGIDAVVDCGKGKRIECRSGIQGLFEYDISKADCMQRKGRAGREKEGTYILCSNLRFDNRESFSKSEIQLSLLDQVVLRLSAIDIDATELDFYHQPEISSIKDAYKVLEILGAIKDKHITELGKKMSKLPLSARQAKMLLVAEELGVVDDVITLCAILEVGTLLDHKDGDYRKVSNVRDSDILAELDIWDSIQNYMFKNLKEVGINGRSYKRVREMREKFMESLVGKITFGSSGDTQAISKAYHASRADRIFISLYDTYRSAKNGGGFTLDRKSTVYNPEHLTFVVANPHIFTIKKRYDTEEITVLKMVSNISEEEVLELCPGILRTEVDMEDVRYSSYEDVCIATQKVYFGETVVSREDVEIPNHPKYAELKNQYMSRMHGYDYNLEQSVTIDGVRIDISWTGYSVESGSARTRISLRELFQITSKDTITLSNGKVLDVYCDGIWSKSLNELRERLEDRRVGAMYENWKSNLTKRKATNGADLKLLMEEIGYRRYAESKGKVYEAMVYLTVTTNGVGLQVDKYGEVDVNQQNRESARYILEKDIAKLYKDKKFMVKIQGKNVMTPKCEKAKQEFMSFAWECLADVELDTYNDMLDILAEAYSEYTADLGIESNK